jgi:hypothetical protein
MKDEKTGQYTPMIIQKHTMSSQFVLEGFFFFFFFSIICNMWIGFSAGFLFILGGVSVFMMSIPNNIVQFAGIILFVLSYIFGSAFFRVKMTSFFFFCFVSILNFPFVRLSFLTFFS